MSATVDRNAQAGGMYTVKSLLPVLRLFIRARTRPRTSASQTTAGRSTRSSASSTSCASVSATHSLAAHAARERGEPVEIEHVRPHRAYACEIIKLVGKGTSDEDLIDYIRNTYRLVLLTKAERRALDKQNRSRIDYKRLDGIEFCTLCIELQGSGCRGGVIEG